MENFDSEDEIQATEISKNLKELNHIQLKSLSIRQLFNWRKIEKFDFSKIQPLSDENYIQKLKEQISTLKDVLKKAKNIQENMFHRFDKLEEKNKKLT